MEHSVAINITAMFIMVMAHTVGLYRSFNSGGYACISEFKADGLGLVIVQCRAVLPSISTALKSHSATEK